MSEPDKPETPPSPAPETSATAAQPPAAPPPPQYGPYPGGYPPPPPQPYAGYAPPPPRGPQNGLGIAALVIAVVALLSLVGGIVLGVVAIILGFLGWGRAKRGEATNGGMAVAGIVLGLLSIIEALAVIGVMIWGFGQAGGTDYLDCMSRAGTDQQARQQCVEQFLDRVEDQFSITVTPGP